MAKGRGRGWWGDRAGHSAAKKRRKGTMGKAATARMRKGMKAGAKKHKKEMKQIKKLKKYGF